MLYAIIGEDVPNSLQLRLSVRPAHLARLESLQQAGRLVVAGPFPGEEGEGFSGSLIVADFSSLEEAKSWADADPYLKAGVYVSVMVKPFKMVFGPIPAEGKK
ncbi:MAG: YciI family protein [Magnetococcales bacterium]|nr:YciI family protein [Magnetococcales bacterium]MBF0150004.1 YciI family protein [Magnetococcales bacterium]MBF0174241.1 YciI family protein [Magnetococcales bacterium]MBF0347769.1 YciI family protein [Magnetococcales bacterium]MBF0632876.1 YciI family protein [Magnetococcales bacterium]